jgi:hypothetical protein
MPEVLASQASWHEKRPTPETRGIILANLDQCHSSVDPFFVKHDDRPKLKSDVAVRVR